MANFSISKGLTKDLEGGFWNDPTAGWTYAGITKKFYPKWPGFVTLEKLRQKYFGGKPIPRYKVFSDAELATQVASFYKDNFWLLMMGDHIADQRIANFIYDFFVHKQNDAIRVINNAVLSIQNTTPTNQTKLTPAVIRVINAYPQLFYQLLYRGRISYYLTKRNKHGNLAFSRKMQVAFVKRTQKFPETI
ncbi:MAG: glycosyl hydrolase 108 family protein [Ferruginibacter sp.]